MTDLAVTSLFEVLLTDVYKRQNDTSPQFKTAVDVFKEKHPDVEIEFVDTAANEYNNKLTVICLLYTSF